MSISDYVNFEAYRLYAFHAWWRACHDHAVGCAEAKKTPEQMWPLDAESSVYDEAAKDFIGDEVLSLPDSAKAYAISLLPEPFRHYAQDKNIRAFEI